MKLGAFQSFHGDVFLTPPPAPPPPRAYYGFDVLFDRPVILEANKEYKVKSHIKGSPSWSGKNGQTPVECQGVQFTFRRSTDSSNGTNEIGGQFPGILFSVSK